MKNRTWKLFVALSLAACTGGAPSTAQQGLAAGSAAQAFGFASYVVNADTVTLLDGKGELLGVLSIEDTSDTSRTVRVSRADGTSYENEVTGRGLPLNDAIVEPDAEGTVQADKALASFFAQHQLAFRLNGSRNPDGKPLPDLAQLRTEWQPDCTDITFPSCNKHWSCSATYVNNFAWNSYQPAYEGEYSDCNSSCGQYDLFSGGLGFDGSSYYCDCYSGTFYMWDFADCPPVSCPSYQRDVVKKTRSCTTGTFTCSNQANGFQYCQ